MTFAELLNRIAADTTFDRTVPQADVATHMRLRAKLQKQCVNWRGVTADEKGQFACVWYKNRLAQEETHRPQITSETVRNGDVEFYTRVIKECAMMEELLKEQKGVVQKGQVGEWKRQPTYSDRAITDLMTGQVDELSVQFFNGQWQGEFNSPDFADAVEIEAVETATTRAEAEAAADAWFLAQCNGGAGS